MMITEIKDSVASGLGIAEPYVNYTEFLILLILVAVGNTILIFILRGQAAKLAQLEKKMATKHYEPVESYEGYQ